MTLAVEFNLADGTVPFRPLAVPHTCVKELGLALLEPSGRELEGGGYRRTACSLWDSVTGPDGRCRLSNKTRLEFRAVADWPEVRAVALVDHRGRLLQAREFTFRIYVVKGETVSFGPGSVHVYLSPESPAEGPNGGSRMA